MSLRSSERGLKCYTDSSDMSDFQVAPFVGAWIEICPTSMYCIALSVAPFVGAWIEIAIMAHLWSSLACRSVRRSVD